MALYQVTKQVTGAVGEPLCQREQQIALGTEPLHQHRRGDAGFPGNGRQRQLTRSNTVHDRVRRRKQLVVGHLSRTGTHRSLIYF